MKSHIAIGSWLLIAALVGCGDDSSSPSGDKDAGMDGGENTSGTGGKGGKGGQSGGGQGGQSSGGTGGQAEGGAGGAGGNGGTGGDGNPVATYTIGGEVSGLKGSGLVLLLNDGNDLSVSADGGFVFSKELAKGADYRVSVKTQPTNPVQACSVKSGEGKVAEADVESVEITCSNVTRSIGGNVSGIGSGGSIILKNNNGDDLTVSQDGTFTFHTALMPGATYDVSIGTSPNGRTCKLTKGQGTLAGNNITDVNIACYEGLTLSAYPRPGSVGLTWNNNGATSYTVFASTDKACTFDTPDTCTGAKKLENAKSPAAFLDLTNGTVYYFSVRGNHPDDFTTRSPSTNVAAARPNTAAFDGDVKAIAKDGDGTIYVGGSFTTVGAFTGPVVPLDTKTGLPSRLPAFQVFPSDARISAVEADGTGGYYVAGRFDLDLGGGNVIHNLTHITNTGAADPLWKPEPGPVDGGKTVRAIAIAGDRLYLSGDFTTVGTGGSNARPGGLAAVSIASGNAGTLIDWIPSVTPALAVDAIAANADTVYVGGRFTAIGGQTRGGLAALSASANDGAATAWDPGTVKDADPGIIQALLLTSDTLYVSGIFSTIGGSAHSQLAALGLTTPATATAFTASPTANNPPTTLALSGNLLYIGGNFTDIGGTDRKRLAALDKTTGALADWNPGADAVVQQIAIAGETVYVAGEFANIANTDRKYLAAIDKSGTGALVAGWDPHPNAATGSISAFADTVYVGGQAGAVMTYNAERYAGLAAFKDGKSLTQWSAAVSGGTADVLALAVAGDNIYVGGGFNKIGTADRKGVAVLNKSGALSDWDAKLNTGASVHALAVSGDAATVYLGGLFETSVGNRSNIVALQANDAKIPTAWVLAGTSGNTGRVEALALDSSTLFVGGDFGMIGSTRSRLASLDAASGAANAWNPRADGIVHALAVVGNVVFAGGEFENLGNNPIPALGAINKSSGVIDDMWPPTVAAPGDVRALFASTGGLLYVGGRFTTVGTGGSNNHRGVVIFDVSGASPYPIVESPDTTGPSGPGVNALLWDSNVLYLGGNLLSVNGVGCIDLCVVASVPPP